MQDKFVKAAPEKQEQMKHLKNQLHLSNDLKEIHHIPKTDNVKYNYESADLLLVDYLEHYLTYTNVTQKTAEQYMQDIKLLQIQTFLCILI